MNVLNIFMENTVMSDYYRSVIFISSLLLLFIFTSVFADQDIAIQAGNILTISDSPIENGTILIKDGKIKELGQNVVIPADVRIIDANDKFVIPGLIDAQSRLFVIDNELNERRTIAPELDILDGIDPFIKEYREVLAQGVTAVYVAPGSRGLIGGKGAVLKLNGSKNVGGMVLKADVAVKAAIGVSSGNESSSLTRLEHYSSIREAFIAAKVYMQGKKKYDRELAEYNRKKAEFEKKDGGKETEKKEKPKRPAKFRSNPTNDVLAQVLRREIPLQIEAHRVVDILNALRLADEFGFSLILDKCTEGYLITDEIARRKVPVIVGPVSTSFIDMPRLEYRKHDRSNAAVLSKNGIKAALGVSGRDGASSKFITLAAAMAAANGMDEDAAVRAITLTPAEILSVADRIGSLEVGKDADLVILSGHPLDTRTRVEMVLIEGKVVFERKSQQ
jgi:imidazolonepropionase-like amidohydrolase